MLAHPYIHTQLIKHSKIISRLTRSSTAHLICVVIGKYIPRILIVLKKKCKDGPF
jgi:hypothetical protein